MDCSPQLIVANATPSVEKALFFFEWLREHGIPIPVLALLPATEDDPNISMVSEIADDFLFLPAREEEIRLRVARALGRQVDPIQELECTLGNEVGVTQIVGAHPSFQQSMQQVRLFAPSDAAVLLTGETGTGKELFAHAIHSLSKARNGPFIPVDCAALPESLAENELFGHCRGAYTNAQTDQKGLAAMAEGGTLFLDEVDSLSLACQAKLLRFLQDRTYRSLGADRFTQANVRVVAATNRRLEDCVREKTFRSDLYFRLNVLRLHLPPLRERRSDISVLAKYFVKMESATGLREKTLTPPALRKLENYLWPGNVRELANVIQRAVICCDWPRILPQHITLPYDACSCKEGAEPPRKLSAAKRQVIEQFEREYVEELLIRHHGNITRAASDAGKERRAFGRLARKYGMTADTLRIRPVA